MSAAGATPDAFDDACLFHICSAQDAAAARAAGQLAPPSLHSEGFVHLSRAQQVLPVAQAFYAGQADLQLLLVDPTLLDVPLRWEAPHPAPPPGVPAQHFPHAYGPIPMRSVVDVLPLSQFNGQPVHESTVALLRHYRFERLPVEGTLYRSTWRSSLDASGGGPAGTAMIGLYAASPASLSCFHRLTLDETWHFYGGDAFSLHLLLPDGSARTVVMGPEAAAGQCVQFVVPAGTWQGGCLNEGGRHALFGCTLAPGFTGSCFEAADADALAAQYPAQEALIRRLAVNGGDTRMPVGFAA